MNRLTAGFLFWEFPTVYISQKLRLAKYLGEIDIQELWRRLTLCRLQHRGMGNTAHAACRNGQLRGLLCSQVPSWYVSLYIIQTRQNLRWSGMCESCVAPCLILIVSMFYKKDEQVRKQSPW